MRAQIVLFNLKDRGQRLTFSQAISTIAENDLAVEAKDEQSEKNA
jgi:hypothetical protein